VGVYDRTGSLLVVMLMHASLAGFTFMLFPPLAVAPNLVGIFVSAAAMWLVVAVVAAANRVHLSQPAPSDIGR
jgi:hypothetical protein